MRLVPVPKEVSRATSVWLSGGELREVHELLDAAGGSVDARTAVAEAYVKGQAEMIDALIQLRDSLVDEITQVKATKGGAPRKQLTTPRGLKLLREEFQRLRAEEPELVGKQLYERLGVSLPSDPDWRVVRKRLEELGLVRPGLGPTFSFAIRPATPHAAWILGGN